LSRSSNNYVYENNINSEDYGIAFNIAEYNVVFNNNIYAGTRSINLYCSLYNDVFGNNFSGASTYVVFLESSDFNNFYWNNFKDNTKVYEAHETYAMIFTNFTYYAEYNKWDNGNEGNFWSDYPDQDNGQGIGNTPYKVYEKFIDNYPLIEPYNTSTIQVTFTGWTDLSIPDYSNSQTSKNFQLISIVVIISVVTLLVGVTCLWRFKKSSKTKLAC
jgi:nitrous oxidase accessory protein NosD